MFDRGSYLGLSLSTSVGYTCAEEFKDLEKFRSGVSCFSSALH
jgi:hypothetical protein